MVRATALLRLDNLECQAAQSGIRTVLIQAVADPDQAFGGQSNRGRQKGIQSMKLIPGLVRSRMDLPPLTSDTSNPTTRVK